MKKLILMMVLLLTFVSLFSGSLLAEDPYVLEIYVPGGDRATDDKELVEEAINEYLVPKIGAEVELNFVPWGSWNNRRNLMMSSGEKFDLIFTANWSRYYQHAAMGAFLPLNDLADEYMKDTIDAMPEGLVESAMVDGKLYAIPVQKEFGSSQGVVLNEELVNKYDFDVSSIKELKDLEPMMDVIKENEPDVYPFLASGVNTPLRIFEHETFERVGPDYVPGYIYREGPADEIEVINQYKTEEYKEFLEFLRDWQLRGYLNEDSDTSMNVEAIQKGGLFFADEQPLKPGKAQELENAWGIDLVQVPLTNIYTGATEGAGSMMAISRTSEEPEKAIQFLNLLHTDKEFLNLVVFGIEGEHFVKVDENTIDFPEGVTSDDSGYNPGSAWMFGNQFLNYLWTNEDPEKWDKFREYNKEAIPSRLSGFIFDTEPVATEIAACQNVISEYYEAFAGGLVDVDEYLPKYIEKLDASGAQTIIDEMQRQIDEWLAQK